MFFGRQAKVPGHVPAPDQERSLALYKYDACGFCQRVMRALDELELDVEMRDTMRSSEHRAELVRRTGRTQVPCLIIDEQPLLESADIVAWLRAYAGRETPA